MGGSISDYDSEDDDDELDNSLKMTEEELKLNPVMKKSKKVSENFFFESIPKTALPSPKICPKCCSYFTKI